MIPIKVEFCGEVSKIEVPNENISFREMSNFLERKFLARVEDLQYRTATGKLVTIRNDEDLSAAMRTLGRSGQLKLIIDGDVGLGGGLVF